MSLAPGVLTTPLPYLHAVTAMQAYVRQSNRRTRLQLVAHLRDGTVEEFHARFGSTLWRAILLPMLQEYAAQHALMLTVVEGTVDDR